MQYRVITNNPEAIKPQPANQRRPASLSCFTRISRIAFITKLSKRISAHHASPRLSVYYERRMRVLPPSFVFGSVTARQECPASTRTHLPTHSNAYLCGPRYTAPAVDFTHYPSCSTPYFDQSNKKKTAALLPMKPSCRITSLSLLPTAPRALTTETGISRCICHSSSCYLNLNS